MKKNLYLNAILLAVPLFIASCTTTSEQDQSGSKDVVSSEKKNPRGGLTSKEIVTVINNIQVLTTLRKCYEAVLETYPEFTSNITVSFKIAADGRTKEVNISRITQRQPSLETCIVETIKPLVFPKPRGGSDVTVNYPFVFELKYSGR